MDQPPKTRFVRSTSGHSGKMERGAFGNWRSQMSFQCLRELYLERSCWGPRFADWKYPVQGRQCRIKGDVCQLMSRKC